MEEKYTVKALAALKRMSINELAEACGIKPVHLQNVSSGRATMLGSDLVRLATFTGVPYYLIETKKTPS